MYDICHPTYYNMSQLGCNDQIKLTTAFYVYMELCEVKRYWDVEYNYKEKLLLFYLQARKSKNGAVEVFIPWPAIHDLSLDLISNIQQELDTEKFTFVFKEGDTTSVYYSVSSGMIKPIHPDETKFLKHNLRKKVKLEQEIQRNAANLYERALFLDNDKSHVQTNMNSLDNEIDDQQIPEELLLEDIENGQSEVGVSQSEGKSDIDEHEKFDHEKSESKNGNLDTEESSSKNEHLDSENLASKCENLETENLENKSENLKTESSQSKSESVETENSETENEHFQTETSQSENNLTQSENNLNNSTQSENNLNNNL